MMTFMVTRGWLHDIYTAASHPLHQNIIALCTFIHTSQASSNTMLGHASLQRRVNEARSVHTPTHAHHPKIWSACSYLPATTVHNSEGLVTVSSPLATRPSRATINATMRATI